VVHHQQEDWFVQLAIIIWHTQKLLRRTENLDLMLRLFLNTQKLITGSRKSELDITQQ